MAREGVLIDGDPKVMDFTISSSATIVYGTLLKYADPRTASASTGTGDIFAGIAYSEKSTADPQINLGVATGGRWKLTASGNITAGNRVKTAAPGNYVMVFGGADQPQFHDICIGTALESASAGETLEIDLDARF